MTASPEVRQLAEKLHAQGICQTMASAFQMAESMLVTSVKVTRDFNSRYEKEDKAIRPSSNPSLVGMHPSVAGMFEDPKDPLADDKDDEGKDPDMDGEEEKVSTMIKSMSHPHLEKPKPLFHAPPTSGMTLHELMDTGNGELRFDGSKVHYNEQKMPEMVQAPISASDSIQSTLPVGDSMHGQSQGMSSMPAMPQVHSEMQHTEMHQEVHPHPVSAPIEQHHAEAPKPVEAPQAATVELPKAPIQASQAEIAKKGALYQKVDLASVFGKK